MKFTPHTEGELRQMFAYLGIDSTEELFDDIPQDIRAKSFDLPEGLSEQEMLGVMKKLSAKNKLPDMSFAGGGVYDHFIPSAVDAVTMRPEFYTAYTPYQPECSQGTLQALFEYQTMMCTLTDMEVSNASLYDGATALAEAAIMALRCVKKRNKIIISGSVNPIHRETVKTYLKYLDVEVEDVLPASGRKPQDLIDGNTAAVLLQNPSFTGSVNDFTDIINQAHDAGALGVVSTYPVSLGMIKTPGEMGADIAVGDGQSLGNPVAFGGPYFGFITAKKKYVRNLPGRIVGQTVDRRGSTGYVLTLQAREQHIKRHKATSNICSNQSLCAMRGLVYLSLLGKSGLSELAEICYQKAEYAKKVLTEIEGVSLCNKTATFNEFALTLPKNADEVFNKIKEKNIIAGLPLGRYYDFMENHLLVALTEKNTKEDIDYLADCLREVLT